MPLALLRSFPVLLLAGTIASHSATITWDGGGTDNKFNTAANWTPDAAVTAIAGNDFRFGTLVGGGQTTADVNVGGNFSSLWFDAGASAMTITGSGNTMQFATGTATSIQNNSSNAQIFNTTLRQFWISGTATRTWSATNASMTYNAVLFRADSSVSNDVSLIFAGNYNHTVNTTMNLEGTWTGKTAGITKNGSGTLLLKGAAAYNGKTTINNGIIRVQNSSSLGTSVVAETQSTSILAGAALEIDGSLSTTEFIRVAGTGIGGTGAIRAVSGTTSHTSQIAMEGTGGATVSFGVDSGAVLKVNRLYSDPGRDTNFEKVGSGTLVLNANTSDDYVGTTTISAGTLQVGDGAATGELKSTGVTNNATLVFNRANTYNYTGNIDGTGTVSQNGSGTLTLSGNSTYSGTTLVSAGTLLVTGSLGNTAVSVGADGTFGGTGSIGGSLHFDSLATLSIIDLLDPLSISGSVTFGSGFGFENLAGFDVETVLPGTYTLLAGSNFDLTGIEHVDFANAFTRADGKLAYFQDGSLQVVVIPEPSSALLGGLALLTLIRRRRSHSAR